MIYQVEAPDGRIISVEGPEGASDEDIIKFAQSQYRAETKISPEVQAERDKGRAAILLQELGKATDPEDKAALRRELARMGIDVSPRTKTAEPSAADVVRQRLSEFEKQASSPQDLLSLAKSVDPAQAAQLAASGLAARGGYAISPAIKSVVERVAEASQRPAFAQPGTAPPAAPTAPVTPRTSGEKWSANWAGQERPGVGGVPEASAAYQRSKGQGKITSEMSKRFGPAAFPPVQPGVFQGSMADRLIEAARQQEAAAQAAAQAAAKAQSPLTQASEMLRTIGRTSANLLADVMRSRAMGALGAGSAAYQGLEALKHLKAGRDEEAALSGAGALGGALMMIPTLPTTMVGGALSAAPYLYRKAQQATPQQVNRMQTSVDAMGNPI